MQSNFPNMTWSRNYKINEANDPLNLQQIYNFSSEIGLLRDIKSNITNLTKRDYKSMNMHIKNLNFEFPSMESPYIIPNSFKSKHSLKETIHNNQNFSGLESKNDNISILNIKYPNTQSSVMRQDPSISKNYNTIQGSTCSKSETDSKSIETLNPLDMEEMGISTGIEAINSVDVLQPLNSLDMKQMEISTGIEAMNSLDVLQPLNSLDMKQMEVSTSIEASNSFKYFRNKSTTSELSEISVSKTQLETESNINYAKHSQDIGENTCLSTINRNQSKVNVLTFGDANTQYHRHIYTPVSTIITPMSGNGISKKPRLIGQLNDEKLNWLKKQQDDSEKK